jgi:hypothetical protein
LHLGSRSKNSQDPAGDLQVFGVSGSARVFVDQAAQDGFSVDPFAVEVGNGEAATVVFGVGDALGDVCVPRISSAAVTSRVALLAVRP